MEQEENLKIKESHNYDHDHNHNHLDLNEIKLTFILNFFFAIIEFIGGILTNSIAVYSNAIHDFGDSIILFSSLFLEKFSQKPRNNKYTYGYRRFTLIGNIINTLILLIGSIIIFKTALGRLYNPQLINNRILIFFAILGIIINGFSSYKLYRNNSSKELFLNIFFDMISWFLILFSALLDYFFQIENLDAYLSIIFSVILLIVATKNLITIFKTLMLIVPKDIDFQKIEKIISNQKGIIDVHDLHIWDLDNNDYIASFHIVVQTNSIEEAMEIKEKLKIELEKYLINHSTIEIDTEKQAIENGEYKSKIERKK